MIFIEVQTHFCPELPATFFAIMSQSTLSYFLNATRLSNIVLDSSEGKLYATKLSKPAGLLKSS